MRAASGSVKVVRVCTGKACTVNHALLEIRDMLESGSVRCLSAMHVTQKTPTATAGFSVQGLLCDAHFTHEKKQKSRTDRVCSDPVLALKCRQLLLKLQVQHGCWVPHSIYRLIVRVCRCCLAHLKELFQVSTLTKLEDHIGKVLVLVFA